MHADLLTDGHDGVKLLVYGLDRDRNLINRHDQPVLAVCDTADLLHAWAVDQGQAVQFTVALFYTV